MKEAKQAVERVRGVISPKRGMENRYKIKVDLDSAAVLRMAAL